LDRNRKDLFITNQRDILLSMATTQITRVLRKVDDSQILKKHSDGSTLPYSGPNLTLMLSGITDPVFVLEDRC
jgi:hypothetical protein